MQSILEKRMNRQQFLVHIGLIFLSITGIYGVVNRVSRLSPTKTKVKASFGNGPYGGVKV
jgi:hypothetical protein